MLDTLSDRLQSVLGGLRKQARLDEETVSKVLREIRLALLEADVSLDVVKDFTAGASRRELGGFGETRRYDSCQIWDRLASMVVHGGRTGGRGGKHA